VVSLFPSFLKFSHLNFPFCSGRLQVHVPLFDVLESLVFKFYGKVTSLPMYELIRHHADRCFVSRSVCLQSFIEFAPLASTHLIHCLLKDIFDLFVQCFCLTAGLRMIWSGNLMINSNFQESFPECPINEV
jgi:hypothetical protein